MAHWLAGRVIVTKLSLESRIKRFFTDVDVMWVIARHSGYIYFKIKWKGGKEIMARCQEKEMGRYFTEVLFHDEMPYVSGKLDDVRIFPKDFVPDATDDRPNRAG